MPSFVGRLAPFAAILLFAGCSDLTGPESLPTARRMWDSQNLSSYEYVMRRTCFCDGPTGPVVVTVDGDEVIRVVDQSTGALLDTRNWPTIEDLFAMVQSAHAADRLLVVEFDEDKGYPTRIETCCLADDSGGRFIISDLYPVFFID